VAAAELPDILRRVESNPVECCSHLLVRAIRLLNAAATDGLRLAMVCELRGLQPSVLYPQYMDQDDGRFIYRRACRAMGRINAVQLTVWHPLRWLRPLPSGGPSSAATELRRQD
jgi:hypothetical protein